MSIAHLVFSANCGKDLDLNIKTLVEKTKSEFLYGYHCHKLDVLAQILLDNLIVMLR